VREAAFIGLHKMPLLIVYLMCCRVFSVFVPAVNPLHAGTPDAAHV